MRIVSLAPSNTEILYALGCGDNIVACTRFCDYPADALTRPRIGGWLDVNDSLVEQYQPDVVMTSTFVQDAIAERYAKKGMRLFHTDPKTLEQVYGSIFAIGELVNKNEEAEELVLLMKKGFNQIQQKNKASVDGRFDKKSPNDEDLNKKIHKNSKTINEKETKMKTTKNSHGIKAYCEEWHRPPTVSGNWVPRIIEIAGGISLCPEGKISYPVTQEEVKEFDPDCIIVSICGMGSRASPNILLERKGWEELRAVKNKNIFVIDDSLLNRPGPRLVEGALMLAGYFQSLR